MPHAEECVEDMVEALDSRRGVLLTSSYEFPGRYARWTLGFSDPPLELSGTGRDFRVRALNDRCCTVVYCTAVLWETNDLRTLIKGQFIEASCVCVRVCL